MATIVNKKKLGMVQTAPDTELWRYPDTNWYHDPDLSAVDGVHSRYWKDDGAGNIVAMDQAERDTVDSDELRAVKEAKKAAIDVRTQDLIYAGFDYDGRHFSMSDHAQINWNKLVLLDTAQLLTYPKPVSTSDPSVEYILKDKAALNLFIAASVAAEEAPRATGRTLKIAVEGATTMKSVEAITDLR